jgi:nucleoid-associated protein YgaU
LLFFVVYVNYILLLSDVYYTHQGQCSDGKNCKNNFRGQCIMKKSDVAIYISAILTLVLTTFVVFSTQNVSYENAVDDLLRNSTVGDHLAMAPPDMDTDISTDAQSPLFRNRLPDESSDVQGPNNEDFDPRRSDARGFEDNTTLLRGNSTGVGAPSADTDMERRAPARSEPVFDDEAQDRIIGRPFTPNTPAAGSAAETRAPAAAVASTPEVRRTGASVAVTAPEVRRTESGMIIGVSAPEARVTGAGASLHQMPVQQSADKADFKSEQAPAVQTTAPQQTAAPRVSQNTTQAAPARQTQNAVSSGGERFHTVVSGDMLRTIAARYGTTTMRLIQLNDFPNPDLIFPGQRVRLP